MSANKVLRVSDFLSERNICFFEPSASKQEILEELIRTLQLPDPEGALQAILARETAGSTVIAPGLAVPHARIGGLTGIRAALGFVKAGTPAHPDQPRIWLLFLGSADNMREHLAFLAGVSALFQAEGLINTLPQLPGAADVLAKIRATEQAF